MTTSEKPPAFTGSCACARITYTATTAPTVSNQCHCITCRKLSGSAYQTYIELPSSSLTLYDHTDNLRYTGFPVDNMGGIEYLRLSEIAARAYCKDCHTPLAMRYRAYEDLTFLALGSVDEGSVRDAEVKEAMVPTARIFMEQSVWWCRGDGEGMRSHQRFSEGFEETLKVKEG